MVHPTDAARDENLTNPFDDAGAVRAVLFLGWIPPVITAVICAAALWVIGLPEAALITLVAGPIVGYVGCLTLLFAGGTAVRSMGASARIQERFIAVTILIGVPVVVALAVLSADSSLGLLAAAVTIGWVVLVIEYDAITS